MRQFKHIFFDWDNTLWDVQRNMRQTLRAVFEAHGVGRYCDDYQAFQDAFEAEVRHLWVLFPQRLITRAEMNMERFRVPLGAWGVHDEELVARMNEDFSYGCPRQTKLCADAERVVRTLHERGYGLHIVTNGYAKPQYTKIEHSGIGQYFDKVFVSDEVGYFKPDVRFFRHALSAVNAKKSEALMVGDAYEIDVVGAQAAGIAQVYVSGDPLGETCKKPTWQIKTLGELTAIL